jgi:hypothetical protein
MERKVIICWAALATGLLLINTVFLFINLKLSWTGVTGLGEIGVKNLSILGETQEKLKNLQEGHSEILKKLSERSVPISEKPISIIRRRVSPDMGDQSLKNQSTEPLKRSSVEIGETFSLKVDAKENCMNIVTGRINPVISEIPSGTYVVTLVSNMDYHNGGIPVKKLLFWIITLTNPKGFFWSIEEGQEITVEVKSEGSGCNLIYAFLVDSYVNDNIGSSELFFKRLK